MSSAAPASASIGELADQIASHVHRLEQITRFKSHPQDTGQDPAVTSANDEVLQKTRSTIIDQCRALINLVAGPAETLKNMALVDKHNLTTLQIINHYSIATKVPAIGQISYHALSQACSLSQDILTRIIRQAMTYNVFTEPQPGYIAHTETSKTIPSLSPLLNYQLEICLPSTTNLQESLEMDEKKTAFQLAHDTNDNWWEFAKKEGGWMEEYGKYQSIITQGGAHDVCHLLNGYDWGSLGESVTVIDIGGGDGSVALSLAQRFPNLYITVQDFEHLQTSFEANFPPSLKDRVGFQAHSFFDPQPPAPGNDNHKARVFLLRHILHDWPIPDCHRILRNLITNLNQDSRLVISEQIMPFSNTSTTNTGPSANTSSSSTTKEENTFASGEEERIMRALDMQMLVQYGSQERTLEDWDTLFAEVGLKIKKKERPKGSADTIMEVALA
ncbi:MAG: hypothetical protein Q9166_003692 [cf. Caloplaca sp. 2 TL-2023]